MTDGNLGPEEVALAALALQIADREHALFGVEPRRTEVVLSDAGLSIKAIAQLMGRNYGTVKMALRRARMAKT
jgi:DNA-directed RNA polymerase specialized sigma24 family protein